MASKSRQALYERQAEIVKALAHPVRLAVVDFLKDGEQCVCHIAEHTGSGPSSLSKHLAVMSAAGLVGQRKEGLKVYYKVKCPCVHKFTSCVMGVVKEQLVEASQLAEAIG
jgi:DNA-binding transcriptional ArsR family regulator